MVHPSWDAPDTDFTTGYPARYPVWPDIHCGRISSVARYPVWPNIQCGWISSVAGYPVWPDIRPDIQCGRIPDICLFTLPVTGKIKNMWRYSSYSPPENRRPLRLQGVQLGESTDREGESWQVGRAGCTYLLPLFHHSHCNLYAVRL